MQKVRPIVTLRVGLARPDVVGVRRAVEFDELVFEDEFLIRDHDALEFEIVLLLTKELGRTLGIVEGAHRIGQRTHRAIIDLFVVRLPVVHRGRRDVEGESACAESERVQARVGVVERGLNGGGL